MYTVRPRVMYSLAMHNEKDVEHPDGQKVMEGAVPAYLLDRENVSHAKVLSNTIKQKRKEKAGKWAVPLPKVRPIAEDEMFKAVVTGKKRSMCLYCICELSREGLEENGHQSVLCW